MSTLEHYRDVEFERWATRTELSPEEAALLHGWVDPRGATVEAGTGGGCVLLALQRLGHRRLSGFDLVPEMIEAARRRDPTRTIELRVADAARLPYATGAFDHALYLRALLSQIEDAGARHRALAEARRILRPGGVALFSFLCLEGRRRSVAFRAYERWLALVRATTGTRRDAQLVPWLRRRGRPNPRALLDRGPHVYWFQVEEAGAALAAAGFRVVAAGSDRDVACGTMHADLPRLAREVADPGVFFVCTA